MIATLTFVGSNVRPTIGTATLLCGQCVPYNCSPQQGSYKGLIE